MDESTIQSRLERVVQLFAAHGVKFIIIGGMAEALYGSARPTYDIDLCYERTPENCNRLSEALKPLQPSLRGAPPDLPFHADARTIHNGSNFTFDTTLRAIDLLGYVEPLGGYDDIIRNAVTMEIAGHDVKVISLDDLIRIKEHINRSIDRESLLHLRAIKQVRQENNQ
ncbi:MAG: hypothetical protein IT445_17600 [Phycisphaeraceae bacterium]|nr:hypothetical protein [Phycisphaeraceae bacterium]